MNTTTNNTENTSNKLMDAFLNVDRVFKMVREKKMVGTWVYNDDPSAVVELNVIVFDMCAKVGDGYPTLVSVVVKMPGLEINGQDAVYSVTVQSSTTDDPRLKDDIGYRVDEINKWEYGASLRDLSEDELQFITCMFGMAGTAPTLRHVEETEEDS